MFVIVRFTSFTNNFSVNVARPLAVKEGSSRAVWADDEWLKQHAGATVTEEKDKEKPDGGTAEEAVSEALVGNKKPRQGNPQVGVEDSRNKLTTVTYIFARIFLLVFQMSTFLVYLNLPISTRFILKRV